MVQRRTYLCLTEEQQGEDIPDDLVDEENVALKNVSRKYEHDFQQDEECLWPSTNSGEL